MHDDIHEIDEVFSQCEHTTIYAHAREHMPIKAKRESNYTTQYTTMQTIFMKKYGFQRGYEVEVNNGYRVPWTDVLAQMASSHGSNIKVSRAGANGSAVTGRRKEQGTG